MRRVYATTGATSYPELSKSDADVGLLVLEMDSGAKVQVHLSRALHYGYCVETEIVGTKCSLPVGGLRSADVEEAFDGKVGRKVCADYRVRFAGAFTREVAAFVDLVLADDVQYTKMLKENDSHAGLQDGADATYVTETLIKRQELGQVVDVSYD